MKDPILALLIGVGAAFLTAMFTNIVTTICSDNRWERECIAHEVARYSLDAATGKTKFEFIKPEEKK